MLDIATEEKVERLTKVCQNWWEIELQPVLLHRNFMQAHQLGQASGRYKQCTAHTRKT